MAALTTPMFKGPDGVLRQSYVFTTTVSYRFFDGEMPDDTVEMKVRIAGRQDAYTNDPDFITFEGSRFTVPNPSASPNGLQLFAGVNVIEVVAIRANGSTTQAAKVAVTLSTEADLGLSFEPPSGVFIERRDTTVAVRVEGLLDPHITGYHFYASVEPGGGTFGYSRINPSLVIAGDTEEVVETLGVLEAEANVVLNPDGSLAANPMYFNMIAAQRNSAGTILQTDFNSGLEIPQTVTHYRVASTVSSVRYAQHFSFVHDRSATFNTLVNPALPNSAFTAIPATDPLYYVVTAVYLLDGVEFESPLSVEVAGAPLIISPQVGVLPTVNQADIVKAATLAIFRSQPQVDLKPGSIPRDTFIDPFAAEADRLRFIVDFLHNAQSFTTLLQIDDPTLSGTSTPVSQSPYKQALKQAFYLTSDTATQNLIDNAFDRLASNYGKTRDLGRRARGQITFVYPRTPGTTLTFNVGSLVRGGSTTFRTTSIAQITPSGVGASFNPATGRYVARAYIQAENPGSAGNLAAGQITALVDSQVPGTTVINEAATFGGKDRESNLDLALRAQGALASVDTGTLQGYVASASNVAGVEQVNVVEAGHPLMLRDRDETTGTHTGGKVDVWVRGEAVAPVTDTFAFPFGISKGIQFNVLGDPEDLTFVAVDPLLSEGNPIIEMLNHPELGVVYEFVNISQNIPMDLTGVQIVAFNTIRLSATYNSPATIHLLDVFQGSYRYRSSDRHVLTQQPVKEVTAFTGLGDTGEVSSAYYALYHPESPLGLGRTILAGDYVKVTVPLGVVPIPSSTPLAVTAESHVMLDGIEYLLKLGASPFSVRVYAQNPPDPDIVYNGPLSPAGTDIDYTFVEGDEMTPLGIKLTSGSRILQGQTVLVDYLYDENFTVAYTTNALVGVTQSVLDQERHATADVLAKAAIEVPVDITATVVARLGKVSPALDSNVRTAVGRLFEGLGLGDPLRPTDFDAAVKGVTGVAYVVLPLVKMTFGDGATVVMESLTADEDTDLFKVTDWCTSKVWTYLLLEPLEFATLDAGGPLEAGVVEYRGVLKDEAPMVMSETRPYTSGVPLKHQSNRAFIIGNTGLVIPGYSDFDTVRKELFTDTDLLTPERLKMIADRQREKSANRVLVTVPYGDTPKGYSYTVSYVAEGDEQSRGLVPPPISYLVQGDLTLTYDEDQNFVARVQGRRTA